MHDACRNYILQKVLLVCAFFTVRHEKFAIVVKCKWGKINLKQTSVSQNYNQNSITLI